MNSLTEKLDAYNGVNDSGDVVPLSNYPDDRLVSDVSITQGMANLERRRGYDVQIKDHEQATRIGTPAVGVVVSLPQHRKDVIALVDFAGKATMYQGLEKGGRDTRDFRNRYERPDQVAKGARQNHLHMAMDLVPKMLHAHELKAEGFENHDVDDMVNATRLLVRKTFGGPENAKKREQMRKRYSRLDNRRASITSRPSAEPRNVQE